MARFDSGYNSFKKYEVQANSISEFLKKYTRRERHEGRGQEYVDCRIQSHTEDLNKYRYTIISHHDSVTGDVVAYYGN